MFKKDGASGGEEEELQNFKPKCASNIAVTPSRPQGSFPFKGIKEHPYASKGVNAEGTLA